MRIDITGISWGEGEVGGVWIFSGTARYKSVIIKFSLCYRESVARPERWVLWDHLEIQ